MRPRAAEKRRRPTPASGPIASVSAAPPDIEPIASVPAAAGPPALGRGDGCC